MSFTKVSIHAPTGGATTTRCSRRAPSRFQFTRPRGARPKRGVSPRSASSFNSRAHGGRDRAKTHHGPSCVFQFTRPRGARPRPRRTLTRPRSFNSRAHGGRDSCWTATGPSGTGFNSRAHGGRDFRAGRGDRRDEVSIHAPTGGATCISACSSSNRKFQFTRPRGARPKEQR